MSLSYLSKFLVIVVDILDKIDGLEPFAFNANYKTVNSVMLKYVSSLFSEGLLDKYMSRYEYMMKCFDKGNDIFEEEILSNK